MRPSPVSPFIFCHSVMLLAAFYFCHPCAAAQHKIQIVAKIKTVAPLTVETGAPVSSAQDTTLFLMVQEGKEARLPLSKKIFEAARHQEYLQREGYVEKGEDLSGAASSLILRPKLEDGAVSMEVVPEISYETPEGGRAIAVTGVASTFRVPRGEPIEIGGGPQKSEFENRFFRNEKGEHLRVVLLPDAAL